jgi:hypothetical protein
MVLVWIAEVYFSDLATSIKDAVMKTDEFLSGKTSVSHGTISF